MKTIDCEDGYYERCRWLVSKALEVNGSIIDIGCADGFMFRDVAKDKTTFVDNSIIAQEKCKDLNFRLADAQNLPFPNNSFDVAVLGEILEHVENPPKVLQEALRVCRKKVLITTPNEFEWTPEARPFTTVGHIRFYTEQMLRDHLSQAGINNYDMFQIKGGAWCFFVVEVIK